jgi:hypothetical protein
MVLLDSAAQQAALAAADAARAKELKQRNLAMMAVCVECDKPADKICEQCGDVYCSITWMGNTGCFPKYHSKGNRTKHTWKPYTPAVLGEDDSDDDSSKKKHHSKKKKHHDKHKKDHHKGKKAGKGKTPTADEKAKKKDGDKRRKALK